MCRPAIFLALLMISACEATADRWSALSKVESGDNDFAVGSAGEVSRYQIKPALWCTTSLASSSPQDPAAALQAAREIMGERCAVFEHQRKRPPTNFEFYVLWNAPARILGVHHKNMLPRVIARRAQRFSHLAAKST